MDAKETALAQKRYNRQAFHYDLTEIPWELMATRRLRKLLWGQVGEGTLLEVGVGTGKNLPYHPQGARVVALDISPRMLRRAAGRARRLGRDVDLLLGDAQRLPFRDGAFDTAVATFVFCSVPDPIAGLGEVRRVVRDGGRVHLLEHVRARNPVAGRIMDLLNPIWVRLMGANINRDTVANVATAGITADAVESRFGIFRIIRGSKGLPRPESVTRQVGLEVG
ncbi:MAG TPA: class I SAM-dependent methyltransferase [Dehalococcoidia bacterium]|nr:class I SAM-dependent methyltransferase [Dehalococcoidia bacterium]